MNVLVFNEFLVFLLLRISFRVLIVAALIWLLIKLCPAKNAAVWHFAWASVLIGMLFFPIVFLFVPSIHVEFLPAAPRLSVVNAQSSVWIQLAAAIYLAGLATKLIRLTIGLLSVKKLMRNSQIINSPRLDFQSKQIGLAGLKKLPILLTNPAVKMPITIGYFCPRIILPENWREWSEAKIRSVLAHEIAHVRRADYLLRLLALLNQCLYWFHPLAAHVSRRLSLLSEKICDETAVKFGGDKREYAEHLLEIAAQSGGRKAPAELCGLAMAEQSQLKQRIKAVLSADNNQLTGRTSRAWLTFIGLFVGSCWYAAASLCF